MNTSADQSNAAAQPLNNDSLQNNSLPQTGHPNVNLNIALQVPAGSTVSITVTVPPVMNDNSPQTNHLRASWLNSMSEETPAPRVPSAPIINLTDQLSNTDEIFRDRGVIGDRYEASQRNDSLFQNAYSELSLADRVRSALADRVPVNEISVERGPVVDQIIELLSDSDQALYTPLPTDETGTVDIERVIDRLHENLANLNAVQSDHPINPRDDVLVNEPFDNRRPSMQINQRGVAVSNLLQAVDLEGQILEGAAGLLNLVNSPGRLNANNVVTLRRVDLGTESQFVQNLRDVFSDVESIMLEEGTAQSINNIRVAGDSINNGPSGNDG